MTINPYARGPRGSGRTSRQIMEAPKSSIYIWCADDLGYPLTIAEKLGRSDLLFQSVRRLEQDSYFLRGVTNWVVVDHAVALSETAWEAVTDARRRHEVSAAQAARQEASTETPLVEGQGPLIWLVYDLVGIVGGVEGGVGLSPRAWDLWAPTMRIVLLNRVCGVLERLLKGQAPGEGGRVGCSLSYTMVEQASFDARREIARLQVPAIEQVREQMRREKAEGWRD